MMKSKLILKAEEGEDKEDDALLNQEMSAFTVTGHDVVVSIFYTDKAELLYEDPEEPHQPFTGKIENIPAHKKSASLFRLDNTVMGVVRKLFFEPLRLNR